MSDGWRWRVRLLKAALRLLFPFCFVVSGSSRVLFLPVSRPPLRALPESRRRGGSSEVPLHKHRRVSFSLSFSFSRRVLKPQVF